MGLKIGIGIGASKARGLASGGVLVPYFKIGLNVGDLAIATLPEPSGLTFSTRPENTNYLWTIQDSGAAANFTAINKATAASSGNWSVTGAANVDWESCTSIASLQKIIAGDVGNNANAANSKGAGIDLILYRCNEPIITGGNGNIAAPDVEIIQCVFPAGNLPAHRDVEAIFADPLTGDVYIVTKRITPVKLYKLAYAVSYAGIQTLTFVGDLTADATFNTISTTVSGNNGYVTDACISPDGSEIILRSYSALYYWKRTSVESIFQALSRTYNRILTEEYVGGGGGPENTASTNPKFFHPEGEPQGESVTFDRSGRNFYTCSEFVSGQADPANVSFNRRRNPLFKYDRLSSAPTIYQFQNGAFPTAGYAGCKDTFVDETTPAQQNNAAISLVLDLDYSTYPTITRHRETFIRWDTSAIPIGKTVVAAFFDFYIGNEGKQIAFYPILEAWNEATITWTTNGSTLLIDTLNSSVFMYGTTQGAGLALDAYVGICRVQVPLSLAQMWVNNPSANFGVMGTGGPEESTGDGLQIDSSEGVTQARKPKFTIVVV